ncbi:hypothetical protein [Polyangium mundeleinium]|uniref:Uncharacterized protein n=1 Tax=Polyangium mundeleinium TaxID=2995306 RepID=A0ABT5EUK9_9BACT|nr:hypothetical protein [Polyangium mundeleinium]MDC0745461.1 hypothetical protein [Polyangium mundeleinium]
MFEIIQKNDQRAPLALMEDHIKNNADDPWTTCPWVKVGNLYMSVTQTSDSSWPTLVKHLKSQGQATFTVFSGRHGTQAGQAVSESKGLLSSKLVLDKAFYQNDVRAAAQFGNAVKVVDVGQNPQTATTAILQANTRQALAGGVVIYAWCHSLFSMMDHSAELYSSVYNKKVVNKNGIFMRNYAVESRALWLSSLSVAQLVTDWYSWVA